MRIGWYQRIYFKNVVGAGPQSDETADDQIIIA